MASPVFVCDVQGYPLMPMAPAYARKLLHQGKARWISHHAFSRIQLNNAISTPVFQPTLLVVSLHHKVAECFLLMEGMHGVLPLLHLLVDLQLPARLNRYRRKSDRTQPTVLLSQHQIHSHVNIRYTFEAVRQTARALSKLLPLRDVVLLPSRHSDRLKQYVHQHANHPFLEATQLSWIDEGSSQPMTDAAQEILNVFMTNPAQYTMSFVVAYLPERPQTTLSGCVCDSRSQNHPVRGLLEQRTADGKPMLLVPYASRRTGCAWQRVRPIDPIHVRSRDRLCFIPLQGCSIWRKRRWDPKIQH